MYVCRSTALHLILRLKALGEMLGLLVLEVLKMSKFFYRLKGS